MHAPLRLPSFPDLRQRKLSHAAAGKHRLHSATTIRRRKELLSIPISGEALHRVKELPYTKRQQPAIALGRVSVIGVELSPEINIDFVVVCKTLRAERLLVRAMFVDISIMRRMLRAGTATASRLNIATSRNFVRKLFPNLIGHIRQRY